MFFLVSLSYVQIKSFLFHVCSSFSSVQQLSLLIAFDLKRGKTLKFRFLCLDLVHLVIFGTELHAHVMINVLGAAILLITF